MPLRGAVVDLDGTVYRGGDLLPGAREGIRALQNAGLDLLYVSNNPVKDGPQYVRYLRDQGFRVAADAARSAADFTTTYLRETHPEEDVLLIGSDALREHLVGNGISLTSDPDTATVLLASWTAEFEYTDMETALATMDQNTTFLGTDPDPTVPTANGGEMPGSGAIINALSGVLEREPDAILGKPSAYARQRVLDHLDVTAEDCLVVGDRLSTDLTLGADAGMTTVLVLSGVNDRSDIPTVAVDPDHVIDNLGQIDTVL